MGEVYIYTQREPHALITFTVPECSNHDIKIIFSFYSIVIYPFFFVFFSFFVNLCSAGKSPVQRCKLLLTSCADSHLVYLISIKSLWSLSFFPALSAVVLVNLLRNMSHDNQTSSLCTLQHSLLCRSCPH